MDDTATALLATLQGLREHVLGSIEGLTPEQLLTPVLPTGWSCAGLVQHLALDVERFWFWHVVAGEPGLDIEADAWSVQDPLAAVELYRTEGARADEVIAQTPIGQAPRWFPDFFGDFRLADLRAVLLHVIVETATHTGHLDAARELLDGKTWLVLT